MEKTHDSNSKPAPLANPIAWTSLVLGIVSTVLWLLLFVTDDFGRYRCEGPPFPEPFELLLFLLTSIPAIVLGHLAEAKIGRIFDPVKGKDAARVGLALGYLMTFAVPLLASSLVPFSRITKKAKIMWAVSNCRQIMTTMRLYSADHGGNYPDADPSKPTNSNDAFRLLFKGGYADNEFIFGCALSPYMPDGNIGNPPDFREALKPGENHWAMTSGLNSSAPSSYPLVFENPIDAAWPPKWNANFVGVPKPGRVWNGNKIIIGMNDSSVSIQALEIDKGDRAGLKPLTTGGQADLFSQNDPAKDGLKIGILNVAPNSEQSWNRPPTAIQRHLCPIPWRC